MKIMQSSPSSAQGAPLGQHRLINRKRMVNYQHKIISFYIHYRRLPLPSAWVPNKNSFSIGKLLFLLFLHRHGPKQFFYIGKSEYFTMLSSPFPPAVTTSPMSTYYAHLYHARRSTVMVKRGQGCTGKIIFETENSLRHGCQ